jgi:hypothetical protein
MTRFHYTPTEPDRARLSAQRCREAKAKVQEFLNLNLTLAEAAEVVEDLHGQIANDLRRKTWHREARQP